MGIHLKLELEKIYLHSGIAGVRETPSPCCSPRWGIWALSRTWLLTCSSSPAFY